MSVDQGLEGEGRHELWRMNELLLDDGVYFHVREYVRDEAILKPQDWGELLFGRVFGIEFVDESFDGTECDRLVYAIERQAEELSLLKPPSIDAVGARHISFRAQGWEGGNSVYQRSGWAGHRDR